MAPTGPAKQRQRREPSARGAKGVQIVRTIWYSPALHFPIKQIDQQNGVARHSWELRNVARPKTVEAARNERTPRPRALRGCSARNPPLRHQR